MRLIVHASGAKRALIGIEDNKPEAIAAMQAAAAGYDTVRVCPVPARFPMGFDKQMVKTLTGIEVPADGRSFDAGVLVNNVGTALAVWQAVAEGRPLVSRLVTLGGACVNAPGNIDVPLGALAEDVLAFAGGLKGDGLGQARRVIGGPMMGGFPACRRQGSCGDRGRGVSTFPNHRVEPTAIKPGLPGHA